MSTLLLSKKPKSSVEEMLPLRAGDHLDQMTFHLRYEAMPARFEAELVQGVVIVPSPLGCPHGQSQGLILTWVGYYAISSPGTKAFDNTTTILDSRNEIQPDAQLVIPPEYGGQGVKLGKYVEGVPQMVVEVAATSEAYDLFEKFEVYQQAGVQEYLVVLVREQEVRWFQRNEGKYEPLVADAGGVIRSVVFPGLWLDTIALFAENPASLLITLQAGLAEPAHADFVQRLAAAQQAAEAKPAS